MATSIARKFEHFVDVYRRADGQKWGNKDLQEATGGVVTKSYVSHLRRGSIRNPGYEKLRSIAKAMGFPPELWFEENLGYGARVESPRGIDEIAGRFEHLLRATKSERTGEHYTSAEVARMSAGDLTEEEVEGIRTGEIPDPSVSQVVALAEVLGVQPSYFLDRQEPPPLDEEAMEALRNETVVAILRESMRLPDRDRRIILGIVRQFHQQAGDASDGPVTEDLLSGDSSSPL